MAIYRKQSLRQLSVRVNKGVNYFHAMKTNNIEKFEYIKELGGGNLELGYYNYIDECDKIVSDFLDAYSEIEEGKKVSAFTIEYNYTHGTVARLGVRMLTATVTHMVLTQLKDMTPQIHEYIEKI